MAATGIHSIRPARCLALLVLLILATSSSASAQSAANPIGDAILAWCIAASTSSGAASNSCRGTTQFVTDLRLYGGIVNMRIDNRDQIDNKLTCANALTCDQVLSFKLESAGSKKTLCYPRTWNCSDPSPTSPNSAADFNKWVREEHAKDILNILFSGGLSEGLSGKDAAQNHAQQFLLNTALALTSAGQTARARQSEAGGLFEFEQYDEHGSSRGIARSGTGLQGLYRMEHIHMSVLGRYAQQNQITTTRSFTIATDFHPSVAVYPTLDLRVGLDARSGLLLSRANGLDLGSLDFGGGVWTSARKDFSRVRIGFGGLLQASKSYVPLRFVGNDLDFLATFINDKPVAWDVSYGALGGYALTQRMSLNAKVLQTVPKESNEETRPTTTIVLGSLSYLVGGLTPVDVGYKLYKAGEITAHSVFVQGYFGW